MSPRPDGREEHNNQILETATAVLARLSFQQMPMNDSQSGRWLRRHALFILHAEATATTLVMLDEWLALLYFVNSGAPLWAEQAAHILLPGIGLQQSNARCQNLESRDW